MQNNLKVFFVENPFRELRDILKQLDEGMNIIYSNCACILELGNQNVFLSQFDTFLYNENSGILIAFKCDETTSKEDIIYWLNRNQKDYCNIILASIDDQQIEGDINYACIPRDVQCLEYLLHDSFSKGSTSCNYYSNVACKLQLCYLTNGVVQTTLSLDTNLDILTVDDKNIIISNTSNRIDENGVPQIINDREILGTIMRCGLSCQKGISNNSIVNVKKIEFKHKD